MSRKDSGSRGRRSGTRTDAELELAPYAVHPGDRVRLRGMAALVTAGPEAARDLVGRRVIVLQAEHPETGEAAAVVCDPAAPVRVARPVLEGEGPRHLKVTAADGTVSYRMVHDDADQYAAVAEARKTGGTAEAAESSGLEDAPATARSLHALAAARGWNTIWTSDGDRGGLLLAVHPDNSGLQVAQGWRDGRKLAGAEQYDFGPLGESRNLIAGNPGRVPGQTADEIAAAKITGAAVPVAAAAGMPACQLKAAGRELARQAALTGGGVTSRHQVVKNEVARRAVQGLPVLMISRHIGQVTVGQQSARAAEASRNGNAGQRSSRRTPEIG